MCVCVFTHTNSSRGSRVFTGICLSVFLHDMIVCLTLCTISQKLIQLGSPNMNYICSTMISGNSFILELKGQTLFVTSHKNSDGMDHCILMSIGFI